MCSIAIMLTAPARAESPAALLSRHLDIEAAGQLAAGGASALGSQEKILLFGAASRGERLLRVLAVEEARSLAELCKCRREMGRNYDRDLLELHAAYAEGLLEGTERGRAGIRRLLEKRGPRWPGWRLGKIYLGTLQCLAGRRLEDVRLSEIDVPGETRQLWRESRGTGRSAAHLWAAALAAGSLGAGDVAGLSTTEPGARQGMTMGAIGTLCGEGRWIDAVAAVRELSFQHLGEVVDSTAVGVAYMDPIFPLALSRIYGMVCRTAGREVLAQAETARHRDQALDWFARSVWYSGTSADEKFLSGFELPPRAHIYADASARRPSDLAGLLQGLDLPNRVECEALAARLGAARGGDSLGLRATHQRLRAELEGVIYRHPASGRYQREFDREAIPGLRQAALETALLGYRAGQGDDALELVRAASADVPPGNCESRIDPVFLLVFCRLEWESSRLRWEHVLGLSDCLVTAMENKPVLLVDVINRWTAALCASQQQAEPMFDR